VRDPVWPASWSLALVNYRGYGASEGSPSERALFADALLVLDALRERPDVDPARVALVGRSLGSGVATYVAANRPVAGVALVSPYDSVTALARRQFPWLPIELLLRHPFDSRSRGKGMPKPARSSFEAASESVRRAAEPVGCSSAMRALDARPAPGRR